MSVRGFRFRPQPALDLRRREDDEAQGDLARADAALREARAALAEADRCARDAPTACAAHMDSPGFSAELLWYHSWIIRLDRERTACTAAVTAREAERTAAAAARVRTHQRVEALERLKTKGARRWASEAAAEEQKHLDALATVRFVGRRTETHSTPHG